MSFLVAVFIIEETNRMSVLSPRLEAICHLYSWKNIFVWLYYLFPDLFGKLQASGKLIFWRFVVALLDSIFVIQHLREFIYLCTIGNWSFIQCSDFILSGYKLILIHCLLLLRVCSFYVIILFSTTSSVVFFEMSNKSQEFSETSELCHVGFYWCIFTLQSGFQALSGVSLCYWRNASSCKA